MLRSSQMMQTRASQFFNDLHSHSHLWPTVARNIRNWTGQAIKGTVLAERKQVGSLQEAHLQTNHNRVHKVSANQISLNQVYKIMQVCRKVGNAPTAIELFSTIEMVPMSQSSIL